ncbi:hypothetical protein DL240_01060 [Lujinxingia litoralis]|uniref:Lipoprotein n=1 Tax=Lujinxingia litoralis TaxID=2211119 RepID=A0A328CCC0_9DELT|nr:PLuB system PQQ-binding repeat protein [Lujinxingia litoralis]RAL24831.1 hypothetical protein DL240_01060 [Lujinxingia litoralis]
MNLSTRHLALAALTLLCAGPLSACQNNASPELAEKSAAGEVQAAADTPVGVAWAPPEVIDLRQPEGLPMQAISIGKPTIYPRCHELFEPEGNPGAWPVEADQAHPALFGCEPEAWLELADPELRLVAYALPRPETGSATDLRLSAYNGAGELLWHRTLSRQHQGKNFNANFRGSFLTRVDGRFICAGTRWQGGTQALCAHQDSGEPIFEGTMNFWSGIAPVGVGAALVGVDINGITLRYPFSGVEMRHRKLEGRGGRTAFYAHTSTHVFFVPGEGDPVLSAWNLETLQLDWQLPLPGRPQPRSGETFEDLGLLVFKLDEHLYALETATGKQRLNLAVGPDNPSLASSAQELLVMVRRSDAPPMVASLNPADASANWAALGPLGSLALSAEGPRIFTRSVRAVREITPADGAQAGAHD